MIYNRFLSYFLHVRPSGYQDYLQCNKTLHIFNIKNENHFNNTIMYQNVDR